MEPRSPSSSCLSAPPISTIQRASGWAGRACILKGCRQSWRAEKDKNTQEDQTLWLSQQDIPRLMHYMAEHAGLTEGSRDMIRTVLSIRPTAKKRDRCSPGGTLARLIHTTSADISFLSVYSFSCPDLRRKKK